MTANLRRILISLTAGAAAYALVATALRDLPSAPTRCPDRATGPASGASPGAPGFSGPVLAGRGSRR